MKKSYHSGMFLLSSGSMRKQCEKQTIVQVRTVQQPQVADIHNAETSLDYEGTYKGVFPAADCPGIETTLTLNPDKTFTLHSVYIDRDSSFDEKGTYTLEGNILTLKRRRWRNILL